MIRILNLNWGYIMVNEVVQKFFNFFSKYMWSVNYVMFFYQIYFVQMSTL